MKYGCTHSDPQESCLWCSDGVADRAYEIVREWEQGREFEGYTQADFPSYSAMRVRAHELAFDEFDGGDNFVEPEEPFYSDRELDAYAAGAAADHWAYMTRGRE